MNSIFEFKSHFRYLNEKLSRGSAKRGEKTRFAEALRIQPAFLSQVLAEKYPLSLEQGDLANQFFDHAPEEADFFLLLISRDRASTASLKKYFEAKTEQVLKKREELAERLGKKTEIGEEVKGIYYSSWLYSAIHVGCTIEELQTRRVISEKFGISLELAESILGFLTKNNILVKDGDRYRTTQNWIRLEGSSPHVRKHHGNWRLQAMNNIEALDPADLHYSGVYSSDEKTIATVRRNFMEFLKSQLKLIEPSPEKELFAINTDVFKILKD